MRHGRARKSQFNMFRQVGVLRYGPSGSVFSVCFTIVFVYGVLGMCENTVIYDVFKVMINASLEFGNSSIQGQSVLLWPKVVG